MQLCKPQKLFFLFLLLCIPTFAIADSTDPGEENGRSPENQQSDNFDKTRKFLPGEEVITPTGKKVKVWSTEGPVRVSPPPQPFDDPSKAVYPSGANVVVDQRPDDFNVGVQGNAPQTNPNVFRGNSNTAPRRAGTGNEGDVQPRRNADVFEDPVNGRIRSGTGNDGDNKFNVAPVDR